MKSLSKFLFLLLLGSYASLAQSPGGMGGPPSGERTRNTNSVLSLESSQPKGNSKISGIVLDETNSEAVGYATIALVNQDTKATVDGTMADENGKFSLTKIAVGNYTVVISFIGYDEKRIQDIKIEKGKDTDLGDVKLGVSSVVLDGITVTGVKSVIEEKVDRLVYHFC